MGSFPKSVITDYSYSLSYPETMYDVAPRDKVRSLGKILVSIINELQSETDKWEYQSNFKFLSINTASPILFKGELVKVLIYMFDTATLDPCKIPDELPFMTESKWKETCDNLKTEKYGTFTLIHPLERYMKLLDFDMSECPIEYKQPLLTMKCGEDEWSYIFHRITKEQVGTIWNLE
jgi:hypothetical protein